MLESFFVCTLVFAIYGYFMIEIFKKKIFFLQSPNSRNKEKPQSADVSRYLTGTVKSKQSEWVDWVNNYWTDGLLND